MAKRKQTRRPMRPLPSLNLQRHFKEGEMPDYKKWEILSHFITERGKIMPRTRTGLNAPMQRRLTREVKRARYLALLPYAVRPL